MYEHHCDIEATCLCLAMGPRMTIHGLIRNELAREAVVHLWTGAGACRALHSI